MTQSQYSLAWESFKTNICSGFSSLQQNGEFVDMTLAADGHLVKVHQVLVALSSNYLKNMIASAPCQHPVIFLNNVSHKVLCYLLEYIYTGEVLVPADYLTSFTEAAKALHIKGLENIDNADCQVPRGDTIISAVDIEISPLSGNKRKAPTEMEQMNLPPQARKVFIKPEGAHMSVIDTGNDSHDYSADILDDSGAQHFEDDYKDGNSSGQVVDMDQIRTNPSNLLYTVSIRGSLQAILNRYIYNLNSTLSRTGVRRWRCVDYRNNRCSAFIVTQGNVVVNRANLHNHPFHDKKILSKIEKKAVFSALDEVEAYRDQERPLDDEALNDDKYTIDQLDEKNE